MGALTSLNLADNNLGEVLWEPGNKEHPGEFWKTSERKYYKALPEGQHLGPIGAIVISNAIQDMRAISTVILDTFPLPIQDIKFNAELDFSGKGLGVEDAIVIAALIPSNVSRISFPHPCYH
jgi:hypothetical protein